MRSRERPPSWRVTNRIMGLDGITIGQRPCERLVYTLEESIGFMTMTGRKSRASRDRPSSSSVVPVARQSGSKACGQAGEKAERDNGVLQLERQLAWQHLGQDEDVHFDEGVDRGGLKEKRRVSFLPVQYFHFFCST